MKSISAKYWWSDERHCPGRHVVVRLESIEPMTRWGVLADIHGNLAALERALAGLRERGVDRIAVLGDSLGRGDSDGCVELIRCVADVSVVGNRDLDWADRVGPSAREYVLALPRLSRVDGLAFSHGAVRLTREQSSDEIRSGFRRARAWLASIGCRAWLFGNTHRARIWALDGAYEAPRLLFDAATERLPALTRFGSPVEAGDKIRIINVGSVGLPFPGKGPASAAVFDTVADVVDVFPV
jgi:predicted phosphodiesterase